MKKLSLVLISLTTIMALTCAHAATPIGGVIKNKETRDKLFLTCESDSNCETINVIEVHPNREVLLNSFNVSSKKSIKENLTNELREEINMDHQAYVFAGGVLSMYGCGYLADKANLGDSLQDHPVVFIVLAATCAVPGLAVDAVKAIPQGMVYGVQQSLVGHKSKSISKHIIKSKEIGKVQKVSNDDYQALRDAMRDIK